MNKRLFTILLLCLAPVCWLGCRSSAPKTADLNSIRNFLRVNESFCTGGQPDIEHLTQLKAEGVKAVINLREPGEHDGEAEAAKVRELGMQYFNIPVNPKKPDPQQVETFLKLTDDPANRPAFVHCAGAPRVGAFWLIRRVLRDGWDVEKAAAEAQKIGLRGNTVLLEFALQYIKDHTSPA